jgi:predicted amidohydrolase
MPVKSGNDVLIGMIIFQPGRPRQLYCKQHLHPDEYPFFVAGNEQVYLYESGDKAGLAICYEISVPKHPGSVFAGNANIYLASVAKTAEGVQRAANALSDTARKYSMFVFMSNCVGPCDNFISAGKSAVWDEKGGLIGELDDVHEGLLIFNTASGQFHREIF